MQQFSFYIITSALGKVGVIRTQNSFLTMKEMEFGKTKGTLLYKTFDFLY